VNVHLYCIVLNLKSISKMSTLSPPGKISADVNGKEAWVPFHWRPYGSFAITAVRNAAELRFSKLRLIKAFHRSTVTDERLTNLATISLKVKLPEVKVSRNAVSVKESLPVRRSG